MAVVSFRRQRGGPGPRPARLAPLADHFRTDPEWRNRLQFNAFAARNEILNGHAVLEPLGDLHVLQVQEKLQLDGFTSAKKETVRDALALVCGEKTYHPVKDWLEGLRGKWDKVERCRHWLIDCLGAEHSLYVQEIGRMFLIAMVARVMRPGCRADYMLVLEGPQGIQKSHVCRVLAGDAFFDDQVPLLDKDPVRVSMALRGKWLMEVAEMATFTDARIDTLKAFITRRMEIFTPKYARSEVSEPRQCLFIGTTNKKRYFRDDSGNRRFWPVEVHDINPVKLAGLRDQLFAEALALFEAGEQWWPTDTFEDQEIKPQQELRQEIEPWVARIEPWLVGKAPNQIGKPLPPVSLLQIWTDCIGGRLESYGRAESLRVAEALRLIGWVEDKSQRTEKTRYWVPAHP